MLAFSSSDHDQVRLNLKVFEMESKPACERALSVTNDFFERLNNKRKNVHYALECIPDKRYTEGASSELK